MHNADARCTPQNPHTFDCVTRHPRTPNPLLSPPLPSPPLPRSPLRRCICYELSRVHSRTWLGSLKQAYAALTNLTRLIGAPPVEPSVQVSISTATDDNSPASSHSLQLMPPHLDTRISGSTRGGVATANSNLLTSDQRAETDNEERVDQS